MYDGIYNDDCHRFIAESELDRILKIGLLTSAFSEVTEKNIVAHSLPTVVTQLFVLLHYRLMACIENTGTFCGMFLPPNGDSGIFFF